jgi:type I restriction-modification system DNA methylase subunit
VPSGGVSLNSHVALNRAYAAVAQLVHDYEAHRSHYILPAYSEWQARQDFIDKFFVALGWDVLHESQKNPFAQEVKVERNIAEAHHQRRADYAFYCHPNFQDVRFYAEAKRPSAELYNRDYYFQVSRYGWNGQTPIAVLTNFEALHVIDCRYKPDIDISLEFGIDKYRYRDYLDKDKFAEIYYRFSREALLSGSLEKYADTLPKKRGKAIQRGLFKGGFQSIDDAFLQELDGYRETLSKSLKSHNLELDGPVLTEISQRILDRLVFLRFLEDKLIETKISVSRFGDSGSVWGDFVAACKKLDGIYNGIVFKHHPLIDSRKLSVDDRVFGDICESLSHINSPYNFDVIPIHILGSIYEQFLGKIIVTSDKKAWLEEKAEVRKAGGVYYTPEYIVRFIVENTVGVLISGKTPAQIANMRFADIACGSGSFLIGAYDCLLRYHTEWYNRNPSKAKAAECLPHDDGSLHLTLTKKREILLRNIYGVDIDPQAVEVAQLSLYLKLLEEETTSSARNYQFEIRDEALLPSLSGNIACGNSLVGTDYSDDELDLDPEAERQLNAMDFRVAFPKIMPRGFDAVIGNPPYIRMESFKTIKSYLERTYRTHAERADIYFYFVERAAALTRDGGRIGYILSNSFARSGSGEKLRTFVGETLNLEAVVEFGDFTPFKDATVYPIILILQKRKPTEAPVPFILQDFNPAERPNEPIFQIKTSLARRNLGKDAWTFEDAEVVRIRETLLNKLPSLKSVYGSVKMGIKTGLNEAFIIDSATRKRLLQANPTAKHLIKPYLGGKNLDRWIARSEGQWLIYVPHGMPMTEYPEVLDHLSQFKSALQRRATKQRWYELQQPQEAYTRDFDSPKIIYPDMSRYPKFSIDVKGSYFSNTVYFISSPSLYLLALLNSNLLWFIVRGLSNALRGGLWRFRLFSQHIERLPIRVLNPSKPSEKVWLTKIEKLVQQALQAKEAWAEANTHKDIAYYERRCSNLERSINDLVYEIYGLSAKDIQLIEMNLGYYGASVQADEDEALVNAVADG